MNKMYEEIENIIVRTLSPFEYEKLEELKKKYSEEQIINAYKTSKIKNINYIIKVLETKKQSISPEWFNKEIINEKIDEETQKDIDDFKRFLEEFRNE